MFVKVGKVKVKIKDIAAGMSNLSVEGKIVDKNESRKVNTRYGSKRVTSAVLRDETGEIDLVLWEDQIDSVEVGDEIEIENAYSTQWKGKLQLNVPRKGKISKKLND